MHPCLSFSPAVSQALRDHQPVLALESTVITHGLPFPQNLETAMMLETIAREQQVTPATIAVMDGKIKIGLSMAELQQLAQHPQAMKASKRDLAYALMEKRVAGTTVAATMYCAHLAGISVFATGGIGGVHRGDAMDISADLIELAQTPVAVICAGAKAILDLPRTLEYLETMSVPVVGYQTETLPAFYTAATAYRLHARVESSMALATLFQTHVDMGMQSGMLVVNPIPASYSIPTEIIEPIIAEALKKAEKQGISGKAITPFLLKEVGILTEGKTQIANIALIKNNVMLGAAMAREMKSSTQRSPKRMMTGTVSA